MMLRPYKTADCGALAALFYQTVHTVNGANYTREQLDAWATGEVDLNEWDRSFMMHCTFVAVENGEIVGFGDMDASGYLDRLYVHWGHQRCGIGTALCDALERQAAVGHFVTHASITARPFFERRGYRVVREQQVICRGVAMTNYVMEK